MWIMGHQSWELVDKFCYLGDILSVDGDADAAVEARIRTTTLHYTRLTALCPGLPG